MTAFCGQSGDCAGGPRSAGSGAQRTHLLRDDTRTLAKLDIVDWIEGFYNRRRMDSSIGYKTVLRKYSCRTDFGGFQLRSGAARRQ